MLQLCNELLQVFIPFQDQFGIWNLHEQPLNQLQFQLFEKLTSAN